MICRSCLLAELKLLTNMAVMARGLRTIGGGIRLCVDPLLAMELEDSQTFSDYMDVRPDIRSARLRKVIVIEDSIISEPSYEFYDGTLTIDGTADRVMCIPVNSVSVIKSLSQSKVIPVYVENASSLTCTAFAVSATRALNDSTSSCEFSLSSTGPWTTSLGPIEVPTKFYVRFPEGYELRKDETILVSYREVL